MTIALLINTFINEELKYNHFKITFNDIYEIFDQIHIKVRGKYNEKCLKYVKSKVYDNLHTYNYLDEKDWVNSTLTMVNNITTKSIFLYNEDHKLNAKKDILNNIIKEFNYYSIDYMYYSFFNSSELNTYNILPLKPQKNNFIYYFELNKKKLDLIGKISPTYYYISLVSIYSKKYLKNILSSENFRFKLFINIINKIIAKLVPTNRRCFYDNLNQLISKLNIKICLYPIETPFNIERVWFEKFNIKGNWRYGISNVELFVNYDDDDKYKGESLIKRGLYPFQDTFFLKYLTNRKDLLSKITIFLKKGEEYDCTYFSSRRRISICPVLEIETLKGSIEISQKNKNLIHKSDNKIFIFSNIDNKIIAKFDSKINIYIYDEAALD